MLTGTYEHRATDPTQWHHSVWLDGAVSVSVGSLVVINLPDGSTQAHKVSSVLRTRQQTGIGIPILWCQTMPVTICPAGPVEVELLEAPAQASAPRPTPREIADGTAR